MDGRVAFTDKEEEVVTIGLVVILKEEVTDEQIRPISRTLVGRVMLTRQAHFFPPPFKENQFHFQKKIWFFETDLKVISSTNCSKVVCNFLSIFVFGGLDLEGGHVVPLNALGNVFNVG